MKLVGLLIVFIMSILINACGGGGESSQASRSGNFVADDFCEFEGLDAPLRHTFVLIDESVLSHTETAAEFIAANAWVRDAVLAVADPVQSINSGVSEPRERITIIRLPREGAGGSRVFTGCIPALSEEEIAQMRNQGSQVSDFFGGGVRSDLDGQAEKFRALLSGALQAIARETQGAAKPPRGNLVHASVFQAMHGASGLFHDGQLVPRLILVTDLSKTRTAGGNDRVLSRRAALQAGLRSGFNLGASEVVVVQPDGPTSAQRNVLEAFLLAQRGRLIYLGNANIGSLPAPPRVVRRYAGEVQYPDGPQGAQIRIGIDRNGKLANSWIILRDLTDRAVPLDGQGNCDGDDSCAFRSTDDGLGQTWSPSPGGQPEFDDDAPLGGMRNFEFRSDDQNLTGRIFDPLVDQIGPDPANDSLAVRANRRTDANF